MSAKRGKMYGLAGYAGVGKDTVGELLTIILGTKNCCSHAFAYQLKEETYSFIKGMYGFDIHTCTREQKETVRDFLVFWGEKRRKEDSDYWLNLVVKDILFKQMPGSNHIITDVRYKNEAEKIQEMGGKIWLLERQGINPYGKEEARSISGVREVADSIVHLPEFDSTVSYIDYIEAKL